MAGTEDVKEPPRVVEPVLNLMEKLMTDVQVINK